MHIGVEQRSSSPQWFLLFLCIYIILQISMLINIVPATAAWKSEKGHPYAPYKVKQQGEKSEKMVPRVLLFLTSHFSLDHVLILQHCWPLIIDNSVLLQNADVLVMSTGPTNTTLLESVFEKNKLLIHEVENPGHQEGAILALQLAAKHRFFDGYDWVIRLNPDVIIHNDTAILTIIANPEVDGIFINCIPGVGEKPGDVEKPALHTDWSAFRPSALPNHTFLEDTFGHAESQFTFDMAPILETGRFSWLPDSYPEIFMQCRVRGSVVNHVHDLDACKNMFLH